MAAFSQKASAQGNAELTKYAKEGAEAAKAGNWDQAIEAFRKSAAIDKKQNKNLALALQQRAMANAGQGNYPKAIADLNEAVRLDKSAASHERRAYVEMKMGDNDKALSDYSEAIKLNPNDARYYNYRAYLYELKSDWKNSMADTEKVLKEDQSNAEAISRKERIKKIETMNAAAQAAANATPIPNPNQAAGITPTPTPTPTLLGKKKKGR